MPSMQPGAQLSFMLNIEPLDHGAQFPLFETVRSRCMPRLLSTGVSVQSLLRKTVCSDTSFARASGGNAAGAAEEGEGFSVACLALAVSCSHRACVRVFSLCDSMGVAHVCIPCSL